MLASILGLAVSRRIGLTQRLLTASETKTNKLGEVGGLIRAVIVASVTDPAVHDATAERGSRSEIYRAAAAERALLDVARVSAAIRQSGAEVVTAAPADLPPALADRYIALKAAGRL